MRLMLVHKPIKILFVGNVQSGLMQLTTVSTLQVPTGTLVNTTNTAQNATIVTLPYDSSSRNRKIL